MALDGIDGEASNGEDDKQDNDDDGDGIVFLDHVGRLQEGECVKSRMERNRLVRSPMVRNGCSLPRRMID
jgi:hypothetical protein